MKKIVLLLLFLSIFFMAKADTLKGGVVEEYIPKGFFGSWGVISKLKSCNNPAAFNSESRDVWTLSGSGNVLILENLESGAHSEIIIKEKSIDGKTLRFKRTRETKTKTGKNVYHETVEFTLLGNNFSGTDVFRVDYYDMSGTRTKTDEAKYLIEGVLISGH